jgi:hypothetical protein
MPKTGRRMKRTSAFPDREKRPTGEGQSQGSLRSSDERCPADNTLDDLIGNRDTVIDGSPRVRRIK